MAKAFDIYYGSPGSAKTRSIIELILHVHATTGKTAVVYTGDGSYGFYQDTGLVEKGIIRLMDFSIRDNPFETLQMCSEGLWPDEPENPTSKMKKLPAAEFANVGLWIFEGASVAGNYIMGTKKGGLAQRAAEGDVIGQDSPIFLKDGELKIGGNAGAHYNVGQRQMLSFILRTKSLPGMVIWTAHERIDDGERGGSFAKGQGGVKDRISEKCIGPEIVGKALTSSISREFRNTLHFTTASKKVQDGIDKLTGKTNYVDKTEYRVYTEDHFDPDGIVGLKYMAVVRSLNPEKIKQFYVADKPGKALLDFYKDLQESNKL